MGQRTVNYGFTLIIWDRILGTYESKPRAEKVGLENSQYNQMPMFDEMTNRRYIFSVAFAIFLLGILYTRGLLSGDSHFDFPTPPTRAQLERSNLRFTESARALGIDVVFRSNWPNPDIQTITKKLRRLSPSIAVGDLDGDGFQGLVVATGENAYGGIRIFKNEGGLRFQEVTTSLLSHITPKDPSNLVALVDVNGDGHLDVVVGRYGVHSLYMWDVGEKRFIDWTGFLGGYHSNPESVAVLDYDQDGLPDLLWGNYYPDWDLSKMAPPKLPFLARGDLVTGGKTTLPKNTSGGFVESEAFKAEHSAHTIALGISDLNQDGFPDVFEGNEYAPDFLFMNQNGK